MAKKGGYKSYRKEVDVKLKASEKAALTAIGAFVESEAKVRTPVDTGNLRDSITYRVNEGEKNVAIGTNAEYAQWVEKGSSRSSAQPFLTPAVESNTSRIQELVRGAWKM